MEDLIKVLSPLGVGGVLAGLMFWFYRQDRLQCNKREDRMGSVVERNAIANERLALNIENLSHTLERIGRS